MKAIATQTGPDAAAVLTKATLRAADNLFVARAALAKIIGLSEATLSRIYQGDRTINPKTKEGELSALLIRLYRSLHPMVGGDSMAVKHWMESRNDGLGGQVPAEYIKTVTGLFTTLGYLDSMRARN